MASDSTRTVPNAATRLFKEKCPTRRAYVTLLAGNGDDLKGVEGLARGLRKVKSKYSLVVAILPDVPEEHRKILKGLGCIVKVIRPVLYQPKEHAHLAATYPFLSNYSKLLIWQFEEYSKMMYLEGDTQVYGNIDFLFDSLDGYIHAPLDCFCTGAHEQWPESFKWPKELGPKPLSYYSASMFVFEPSTSTSVNLLNNLRSITRSQPIPFAEQHVFNMYFRKRLIPFSRYFYGELTMVDEKKNIDHLEEVMVLRYGSPQLRPWRHPPKMGNPEIANKLKRKWIDIYKDQSSDFQKQKSAKMKNFPKFPSATSSSK
ncbi:hypothetical protein SLEP1_g57463 [Rubroshorea leprosula]|uniref:Hexosyltransferase n=1 Tax=Rubroshorea leprosula TaxID=152421 RepID=A0AAV5MLB8_9ROSI|nr:hypothetical protein SLEP1_g57463 [Rubroshorea leprosula]